MGNPDPDKPEADYIEFATQWYKTANAVHPHCDGRLLHDQKKCWVCALPQYAPLHEFRAKHDINYSGETNRRHPCPVEQIRSIKQAHLWHGNHPQTAEERDAASKKFKEELTKSCNSYGISIDSENED